MHRVESATVLEYKIVLKWFWTVINIERTNYNSYEHQVNDIKSKLSTVEVDMRQKLFTINGLWRSLIP